MTAIRDRVLAKIKKLLAVANNESATEAEVESYMAAARKLMDEHGIEEEEAFNTESGRRSAYDTIIDSSVLSRSKILKHEIYFAIAICDICDVGFYRETDRGQQAVHFYGLPTDVAVARELFAYLCVAVKTLAKKRFGPQWGLSHFQYCEGFGCRITDRARDMKKQTQVPGLVVHKGAMLAQYAQTALHLRTASLSNDAGSRDSGAFGMGWNDGAAVDLGVSGRLR